jgi:hypothetical protein
LTLPADELGDVLELIRKFDALSGTHQVTVPDPVDE